MAAKLSSDPDLSEENDILARHRKEIKDLRAKIQALKKGIPKGDKKKKKEVGVEIARLEQELEERHKRELEDLKQEDSSSTGGCIDNEGETVEKRLVNLSLGSETPAEEDTSQVVTGAGKKSRAQKRKEKKAQKEQERGQRIAEGEAEAAIDNPRLREREKLTSLLSPLGMEIKDIPSDGHCLYAAIADQLSLRLGAKCSVSELRSRCAEYIHSHSDEFLPYLIDPETGDLFSEGQFDQYCTDIAETATWGGQPEIRALSHVYKIAVKVYQGDSPLLTIGEEYTNQENALTLAYHLHEYGLGEHYNSVVPR